MSLRSVCGIVAALVLLLPCPAWAGGIDVIGADNVASPEPCVVGDVSVSPTDDGLFYTGFTITNPSATSGCVDYTRWIFVRVIYDATGDSVPDGSFYMVHDAEVTQDATLGVFGGRPAIWADHGYKVKVLVPPLKATTTFLHYYSMVNAKRDEIVP